MKMRITAGPAKVGYIVGALIGVLIVSLAVSFVISTPLGQIVGLVLEVVALLIAVRCFRGPSEDLTAPRAWWRMTERPASGYVFTALFVLQSLAYATGPGMAGPVRFLAVVVSAVAAVAFLHSSVRLTRQPDDEAAPQHH